MSFSFASIFSFARTVLTDVAEGAAAITPVAVVIPGAGPVVAAVSAATAAAGEAITAGEGIIAAVTPEITQLEALFASLFHVNVTPGAIVLTPKTSTATVSATPATMVAATAAAS